MFGIIHESLRQLILQKFGEELWTKILARAGFEDSKEFILNHSYPDSETAILIDTICDAALLPKDQVWEANGAIFIDTVMEMGWEELLRAMSPTLKGFLDNLDSLHYFVDHSIFKTSFQGPSFRCEENKDGSIVLHYYSSRIELHSLAIGILREVARHLYKLEVTITLLDRTQNMVHMATGDRIEEHVVFLIKNVDGTKPLRPVMPITGPNSPGFKQSNIHLTPEDMVEAFPYHIVIDETCKIVQVGRELYRHIPRDLLKPGTPLVRVFEIKRPQIIIDFENLVNFSNGVFVRNPPLGTFRQYHGTSTVDENRTTNGYEAVAALSQNQHFNLKGEMLLLTSGKHIVFLCSPYLTGIQELLSFGMSLSALPLHDATRDLLLLSQQRLSDVETNTQLEAHSEKLEQMAKDLVEERKKAEGLLKQILPPSVVNTMMIGKSVDAREYQEATVMFTDVPSFQQIVPHCRPQVLIYFLNELFTKFDRLVVVHKAYKVETVGDSYMVVGGVPDIVYNHSEIICHIALGMLWEASKVIDPVSRASIRVRCGIHSGSVVAGVIGAKMPRFGKQMEFYHFDHSYCLFGDTVNTASRMESHSPVGRIHCSDNTVQYATKTGRFEFVCRGKVFVKGKGEMSTYFLMRSYKKSIWEIVQHKRDTSVNTIDGYKELSKEVGITEIVSKDEAKSGACIIS